MKLRAWARRKRPETLLESTLRLIEKYRPQHLPKMVASQGFLDHIPLRHRPWQEQALTPQWGGMEIKVSSIIPENTAILISDEAIERLRTSVVEGRITFPPVMPIDVGYEPVEIKIDPPGSSF